jgi:SMC interacting uncharacterized protein involved in chromosome segregation
VSTQDLQRIQNELKQELEALKVELGVALKGTALKKIIEAERNLNAAQRAKLDAMQAEIDAGKTEAAKNRAEIERLRVIIAERDKLIKKIERQHRKQHRKIIALVFTTVGLTLFGILK